MESCAPQKNVRTIILSEIEGPILKSSKEAGEKERSAQATTTNNTQKILPRKRRLKKRKSEGPERR